MGFEQVFNNPTVNHMDALRKQIQSLVEYLLNHCFWASAMLKGIDMAISRSCYK